MTNTALRKKIEWIVATKQYDIGFNWLTMSVTFIYCKHLQLYHKHKHKHNLVTFFLIWLSASSFFARCKNRVSIVSILSIICMLCFEQIIFNVVMCSLSKRVFFFVDILDRSRNHNNYSLLSFRPSISSTSFATIVYECEHVFVNANWLLFFDRIDWDTTNIMGASQSSDVHLDVTGKQIEKLNPNLIKKKPKLAMVFLTWNKFSTLPSVRAHSLFFPNKNLSITNSIRKRH
jgi:hypothetical protein